MDETRDQSDVAAILTEAGRETKRGVLLPPRRRPGRFARSRALCKGALESRPARPGGPREREHGWPPGLQFPGMGGMGPGAPGWRDVPWFRFPLLFVFGTLPRSPHRWLFGGSDRCFDHRREDKYMDLLDHDHVRRLDWACDAPPAPGQRAAQVSPSDIAVVLSTSGSTAAPKGVRMSHAQGAGVGSRQRCGGLRRGRAPNRLVVALLPHRRIRSPVRGRQRQSTGISADGTLRQRSRRMAPIGRQDPCGFHLRAVLGVGGGLAGLAKRVGGRRPVVLERRPTFSANARDELASSSDPQGRRGAPHKAPCRLIMPP